MDPSPCRDSSNYISGGNPRTGSGFNSGIFGEGFIMEFGIAVSTAADSWKVVARAEELGFRRAWFYDTQMISADCFVAMGAAAVKTSRIRLGTGVLVPSNRIAAVTANSLATL